MDQTWKTTSLNVPGRQGCVAVPEKDDYEDDDGEKVGELEDFVAHFPARWSVHCSPDVSEILT